jgi:hypothetical protein
MGRVTRQLEPDAGSASVTEGIENWEFIEAILR